MPQTVHISLVEIAPQFANPGTIAMARSQALASESNATVTTSSITATTQPNSATIGTRDIERLAWRISIPPAATATDRVYARIAPTATAATTSDMHLAHNQVHFLACTTVGERLTLIGNVA